MADTASYAGAMKTRYPDTTPYRAKAKGDRRPGSLRGGMPIGTHRSAAQKRLGRKFKASQGAGARMQRPTPKVHGNLPM